MHCQQWFNQQIWRLSICWQGHTGELISTFPNSELQNWKHQQSFQLCLICSSWKRNSLCGSDVSTRLQRTDRLTIGVWWLMTPPQNRFNHLTFPHKLSLVWILPFECQFNVMQMNHTHFNGLNKQNYLQWCGVRWSIPIILWIGSTRRKKNLEPVWTKLWCAAILSALFSVLHVCRSNDIWGLKSILFMSGTPLHAVFSRSASLAVKACRGWFIY